MEEEKVKTKPIYARDEEERIILYDGIEINNENYSAADICFICDATASMNQYMEAIRKSLISFLDDVKLQINMKPRVAFIAFRDKGDEQVEPKDFTTDYDGVVKFIESIECKDGGDPCENLVGALKAALKLDWSSDLNYVYLITGSPPHGKSYHEDSIKDDYPDDDETKPLEKIAAHYRKSKINFVIVKCNNTIDKMIEVIKKYYDSKLNKLRVIDINKDGFTKEDFVKHFLDSLSKEMSDSLAESRRNEFKWIRGTYDESMDVEVDQKMGLGTQFEGITHTGFITGLSPDNRKYNYTLGLTKSDKLQCKIETKKVGNGIFSKCHRLKIGEESDYVAKLPVVPVENPKDLLPDIEGALITRQFANKFNKFLEEAAKKELKKEEDKKEEIKKETDIKEGEVKKEGDKKDEEEGKPVKSKVIKVLSLIIIEKSSPDDSTELHARRKRIFTAQKFLKGEYIKYNNNYGWKRQDSDFDDLLAQAFSHFTYEYSMGLMMVVDIQGVTQENELIITDPAIHSYVLKDRFGETNHGKIGMIRFFETHTCNDYCKKLDLMDPKTLKEIDKSKVDKAKEKYKEEMKLKHLYKEFEIDPEGWKKRIQSFDESLDPDLEPVEEGVEEAVSG